MERGQWPQEVRDAFQKASWDEEHGDRRNEIVCIGRELDCEAVSAQLEACLLTAEEMAALERDSERARGRRRRAARFEAGRRTVALRVVGGGDPRRRRAIAQEVGQLRSSAPHAPFCCQTRHG